MVRLKRCLEESQGLQWLTQIMTCGGKKARFCAIGQLSRFPCPRKLLLKSLTLGNVRCQPIDICRLSSRIELDDRDLFQPDFTTIGPPVAECDRMRGLPGTSTVEAGRHARLIFRMNMFQPFSPFENMLRAETEDFSRILAVSYFVGRHIPIEGYDAAGPKRLLQSGLPLQNDAFVEPPLAEQGRNNQSAQRGRQNSSLGPDHTLFDRQPHVPENADCEDRGPDNGDRAEERCDCGEGWTKARCHPEQQWAERADRHLRGPRLVGQEHKQRANDGHHSKR